MKKTFGILALFLIVLININFTFACKYDSDCQIGLETCQIPKLAIEGTCVSTVTNQPTTCDGCSARLSPQQCAGTVRTCDNKSYCCPTTTTTTSTKNTTPSDTTINGITIGEKCLTNGQCKFNIYDTLGIRKSVRSPDTATSVGLFVQDIVLSATFFIGTVVTIALIVSGLMYIFAAASGKDPSGAKNGIIGALIGLVLVACSYFIIRLIQYLAKGV